MVAPGFIDNLDAEAIASPCINLCRIDPETRLCEGCARSLHEIGGWMSGTPEWRASVIAALPARRARRDR